MVSRKAIQFGKEGTRVQSLVSCHRCNVACTLCFGKKKTAVKKYKVTWTKEGREELSVLTSKGLHRSQKVLTALILLNCDESEYQGERAKNEKISNILQISMKKIDRVKKRFVEGRVEIALNGHQGQRVFKKKVDGDLEARLIALGCSKAPNRFSRWSLRILADKAVELEYVDGISHEPAHCYVLIAGNRNSEVFYRLWQTKRPMREREILISQDTRGQVSLFCSFPRVFRRIVESDS